MCKIWGGAGLGSATRHTSTQISAFSGGSTETAGPGPSTVYSVDKTQ